MLLTEILGRLKGVETDHDGYLALCPAHSDRHHPSLKLTLKDDGKLLIVCRTGCKQEDILQKLRLNVRDLFDVDGQGVKTVSAKPPETIGIAEIASLRVAVNQWTDALQHQGMGEEFAATARQYAAGRFGLSADQCAELLVGLSTPAVQPRSWLSSTFSRYPRLTVPLVGFDGVIRGLQGRDISGKCPARWVSLTNVGGRQWAKYGLLSAGTGYNTILITEGPGDGLTTVGVGYDALIIRGAGLARGETLLRELVAGLRGRDVVLAFDPDTAGERGTSALAAALAADGNPPRHLRFPNAREDLTDWRERNPDAFAEELHQAVRAASAAPLDPSTPLRTSVPEDDAIESMSTSSRELFDSTDVGIAVRLRDFMRRSGGGVRYAAGLGFLVWDGSVWQPGDEPVRKALHLMGAELIATADDASRKLALKALTSRSITAVIKELPAVPGVAARAEDFDSRPELLSVANGTIDLRTGTLRSHDPDDMITKRLDIDFRPDASATRWREFLTEIFPNHPELPAFMQRLIGYGITGSVAEQCFAFMHGQGANGKSAFMDALRYVLGGISKATEFTTFEQRVSVGQASPELAALRGARIVTAAETEKYSRLAEALIKQLTGGDPTTVRALYGSPFTYVPSFLLMVAGNYKPAILSQDLGIWRRVKLIPFEATFRGPDVDPTLPQKLRDEAQGILAWAVEGAQEWYEHGLQEPASVSAATQDYRESEDRLAEFIESRLVQEPGARVAPMPVRRAYIEWAEDAGLSRKETLSGWALGVELEARGWTKGRVGGERGFAGIRLMTEQERSSASRLALPAPQQAVSGSADIFGQSREETAA
ncbi:phage/plasmid primase, P4 family [Streptomyces sp. NPDC020141]|uniref:phage/plasmid primase, P4 family n=1 Tax=Streptomyces sp. NPDC020141 TaxID=3365065 RepID=UPI0037B28285